MKYEIIGVGTLGSELAYTLMLMGKYNHITLVEPYFPNQKRARAEYLDLLPVAVHSRNMLHFSKEITNGSDTYIITSGVRRKNVKQSKLSLLKQNLKIVREIVKQIPKGKNIYIATNPPEEICAGIQLMDSRINVIPLRHCTDYVRAQAGNAKELNAKVLKGKGYTSYTPSYAMAIRVLCK